MLQFLLTFGALLSIAATPAQGECRWARVDGGEQREICDNAWDLGTLQPLPSLPNLPTLRPLEPLPPLPPLGATGPCHQAEVQFGSHSEWLEVCPTGTDRLLLPGR